MRARATRPSHPIFELAQQKWLASGLTDDHATKLKLTPLTGEETRSLHPKFHPVGALKIPYFDLKGKLTGFYRVRYLEPLPGFAGRVEKPQRYVQEPGSLNEVYLPPLMDQTWEEIASDATKEIVITEGELKAASGCAAGVAVVGLGGVDVWRSAKRGIPLLTPLDGFVWNHRRVTIVFDSDAAQKPDVLRAQRQLGGALLAKGAVVRFGAIPPGPGGAKVGLDDLLVGTGGLAGLHSVLDHAVAQNEGAELWGMNEELVYVNDPGLVVERESGRTMDPGKFTAHHYSNRYYVEETITDKGRTMKKKPLASRWLAWEHRFERRKLVYEPGKPRLLDDGSWNTWAGWGVLPKKGDVGPWKKLLDFLFHDAPESRQWFERWCAYPLQHPGTKLYTAAVLWSVHHGMGKGLVEYMLAAIYGKNAIEIDSDMLRASFNDWSVGRQFVIGNEITAGEARLDKDKLKGLITRKDIAINEKYLPRYRVRDCINYIFDSNSPDALFVEDNDRRYFIHEVIGDPAPMTFYEEMDKFLKGEGPAFLFDHLLNLDLGDFKPLAPALPTIAKRAMIMNAKSDLAYWITTLRDDPATALKPLGERVSKQCDLFTPQQLLRCYDPEGMKRVTAPGMARELIRAGFRMMNNGSPTWTKLGAQRLYAIRNITKHMGQSATDLAEHFEKYFGPNAGKF